MCFSINIKSRDSGGHRESTIIVGALIGSGNFPIHVKYCYQNRKITVGFKVRVADYPALALKQVQNNDEAFYGCPHHYGLNEDKTKILYFRHGTNCSGETGNYYVESEIEELILEADFSKEEISSLPDNSLDTYHESTKYGILQAGKVCEMLRY